MERYLHPHVHCSIIYNSQDGEAQPKCPSTEKWKKKMWYISRMEYYSAIKKNEILPFVTIWIDLEGIMLNEISETEKNRNLMISYTCGT